MLFSNNFYHVKTVVIFCCSSRSDVSSFYVMGVLNSVGYILYNYVVFSLCYNVSVDFVRFSVLLMLFCQLSLR